MVRLDDKFAFVVLKSIWVTSILDASEHRLGRSSFMFHVITAQVARCRGSCIGRMSWTSGSRTIIVKSAKFGIRSFCAIRAGSALISVAFNLSL